MKGAYILLLHLTIGKKIAVGKMGEIKFSDGYYMYIGSALNGLQSRIRRHQSTNNNKKLFWHIDYLIEHVDDISVFIKENEIKEECVIANIFTKKFDHIKDFGSSDCNCRSHLFYSKNREDV